jgi:hypothetical protein
MSTHAGRGFTVDVPSLWELHIDPRPDVAVAALGPESDPWGFRTNVVVTVDELDRGMTLLAWQGGADELLPSALGDFLLVDREHVYVGERAGIRRLVHYAVDGRSVTLQQWATIEGPRGYTLSASVSTLAYPRLGSELESIAATFRVFGGLDEAGKPT